MGKEKEEDEEPANKEPNIVTNPPTRPLVLQTSKYSPQMASEVAK